MKCKVAERLVLPSLLGVALLSGCASAGVSSAPDPVPAQPAAQALLKPQAHRKPSTIVGDDWITFAHDYQRTGFQAQSIGFTASSVAALQPAWSVQAPGGGRVYASPLVYGGNVYVVTEAGTVSALNETSGSVVWSYQLPDVKYCQGETVVATPSIDPTTKLLFVADKAIGCTGEPSDSIGKLGHLYAINLSSGTQAWMAVLPAPTHDSPLIVGKNVYIGTSDTDPPGSGDPGTCALGGIEAFIAATGQPETNFNPGANAGSWILNPPNGVPTPGPTPPDDTRGGGGVWGDIGYDSDDGLLLVPTSNVCGTQAATIEKDVGGSGVLALSGAATRKWKFTPDPGAPDMDTGSGVMYSGGNAYFFSKDGNLYARSASTGAPLWNSCLNPSPGQADFATPTTNGTTIVAGGGFYETGTNLVTCTSTVPTTLSLAAYDIASGNTKWSMTATSASTPLKGYAAISNGMVFVALNGELYALQLSTGAQLWSFAPASGSTWNAAPAVVPSGVYDADAAGKVFRFCVPSATCQDTQDRRTRKPVHPH